MPLRRVKQDRANFIAKCMAQQMSRSSIVKATVEKFGVAERTARAYIEIVNINFSEESKEERPYRKVWLRRSFQTVFRKAMHKGDFQAANRALDRLAQLDGLYAPEQVTFTGAVDHSGKVDHEHKHDLKARTTQDLRNELAAALTERKRMLKANQSKTGDGADSPN